jgi:hypothetical protein
MDDRYGQLKPGQIAAALRSYPRRYGTELSRLSDPTLASRDRPDDTAAFALVQAVVDAFRHRFTGLHEIVELGHVTMTADVLSEPVSAPPTPSAGPSSAPEQLAEVAEQLAAVVDAATTDDWNRAARRPDGSTLTAIDIARDATRVGAERLRELTRMVDGLVGSRLD